MHVRNFLAVALFVAWSAAFADGSQNSAFDRALSFEQSGALEPAREAYGQLQTSSDPGIKRAALLGLARVARAQNRLADAKAIYSGLLSINAADADAINGMAWVALADYDVGEAQAGFQKSLGLNPGNDEALIGLAHADRTLRYHLDVKGSWLNNDFGSLGGGSVGFAAALDSRQSVDAVVRRNSADVGLLDQLSITRLLPSTAVGLGYRWQLPNRYGFRVDVEHIERRTLANQQRLGVEAEYHLIRGLRASAGVRQSFGTGWRSQLRHAGLSLELGGGWEAVVRLYSEKNTELDKHRRAFAVEAVRQGPGRMVWVVGASHGSSPNATDLYARTVYPVTERGAIVATVRRLTLHRETQVEVGWRQSWN